MAPKRYGYSALKPKRWIAEKRQELINSGVSEEIYKNGMRWLRLLLEGVDYEKQWGAEMLRGDETKVLHALFDVNSGGFDFSRLL